MHAADVAIRAQLRLPDTRPIPQWILDSRIKPPGSAKGTMMDLSLTPWLIEPIAAVADNRNREVVMVMPTGAGKTTVLDGSLLYATKEDPGSILLAMQTDEDADGYFDERLEPMLLELEGVGDMIRRLPRGKRRKGELVMPHMTLFVVGAKISAFQRKSVRYVFLDEVWQIKHGLVAEARGRHHDRWNARVVLVSQGGWQMVDTDNGRIRTELFDAWERSDKREWCFLCPHCQTRQPFKWRQLKWQETRRQDGSLDEGALAESVHYECENESCKAHFRDDIQTRRALAQSGAYVATNPNPIRQPGLHVGFHCNALTRYEIAWASLVVEWIKAMELSVAGDKSALQVFIQKRLAEFWKDEEDAPSVVLNGAGYRLADYNNGEPWEGESHRFMTIDRQRDHFWAAVRVWKPNGDSRLVWCGKSLTIESCREIQLRFKVRDALTFQDAQHETGQVYDDCAKYGWTALHGSGESGFDHTPPSGKKERKFYSPVKMASAPCGRRIRYIYWSNEKVKDLLAKHRAGRAAAWESPDDVGLDWPAQMNSEIKKDVVDKLTKQVRQRWVKIGSRPNHLWDCEAMQICAALMMKILNADSDLQATDAGSNSSHESNPVSDSVAADADGGSA